AKGQTAVLLAIKHPQAVRDLKLSTYRHTSRKWFILRALLLGLSDVWAGTPELIIRSVEWLERHSTDRIISSGVPAHTSLRPRSSARRMNHLREVWRYVLSLRSRTACGCLMASSTAVWPFA